MIKVVLYDTDGMIAIGQPFSNHYSDEFNIPHSRMLPFFQSEFKDCMIGKADIKQVLPKYFAVWEWQGTADELLQYWFTKEHVLDYELLDFAKELQSININCSLTTNQEKYRVEYMKNAMQLDQIFNKIYASCDIGYLKPDPLFFEYILTDLKDIKKNEIIFWDDKPENIKGALEYGILAEQYTDYPSFKQKMYTLIRKD